MRCSQALQEALERKSASGLALEGRSAPGIRQEDSTELSAELSGSRCRQRGAPASSGTNLTTVPEDSSSSRLGMSRIEPSDFGIDGRALFSDAAHERVDQGGDLGAQPRPAPFGP